MDPQMLMALAQMAQQQNQQLSAQSQGAGYAAGSGGDVYGALGNLAGNFPGGYALKAGLGYLSGKKAKKKQKKLRKRIEAQRQATAAIVGKGLSQQEALARQATQQRMGGFDTAKRAAEFAASNARQTALQRGQQQQAALSQGLTNRGLGSTTVGASLGRGITADTSRVLGGIDEGLGNYFGQLAMGRAGIEAGGTESLADLAAQRSNFDVQNANFWSPYNWQRLGGVESQMNSMGGFDLSSIYGQ